MNDRTTTGSLVLSAVLLEAALGILALGGGWWLGVWPLAGLRWDAAGQLANLQASLWGVAAALPLGAAYVWAEFSPWLPVRRFRRFMKLRVAPLFRGCTKTQLLCLALAAGIGEEIFFRGLVQAWLQRLVPGPWSPVLGLLAASLAFGVCHWLSPSYALLATLAGLYLGLLQLASGHILVPVAAHAAYDGFALLRLSAADRRRVRTLSAAAPDE